MTPDDALTSVSRICDILWGVARPGAPPDLLGICLAAHLTGGVLETPKIGNEASTDTNKGWRNSFQSKVSIHSAKQNVAMITGV